MTDLKGLTEKEFNQLKPKAVYPTVTEDLQEELTFSQKTSKELETGYEGLRKVIFKGLLRHQVTLRDIPQTLRMNPIENNGYFCVAAHRYASGSGDIDYLTEVLSTMYEDAAYGVSSGVINHTEFYELICSWLNYLDYDKIEFKGDDDFERYFQEQKARHKEYFEAFWI